MILNVPQQKPSVPDLGPEGKSVSADRRRRTVDDEWVRLLDDDAFRVEANIQAFLERHPSLIPGAFGASMRSGHPPWPNAVFTQPPLPGLSTKTPDFMWIASDSASVQPVLIEIETPNKRWLQQRTTTQHSDLTVALSQLAHWRAWFAAPGNQSQFRRIYQIPRELMDLPLDPRYVLIHGRSAETRSVPERSALRSSIVDTYRRSGAELMSFDALRSDSRSEGFFTVRLESTGAVSAVSMPATFEVPSGDCIRMVTSWQQAIECSPDLPPAKAAELRRELDAVSPTQRGIIDGVFRSPRGV
jgi:hypothetical protein